MHSLTFISPMEEGVLRAALRFDPAILLDPVEQVLRLSLGQTGLHCTPDDLPGPDGVLLAEGDEVHDDEELVSLLDGRLPLHRGPALTEGLEGRPHLLESDRAGRVVQSSED